MTTTSTESDVPAEAKVTETKVGETKTAETAKPSPEALLKAAVSRAKPAVQVKEAPVQFRPDRRILAAAGGALALGLICGAGLTAASLPRGDRTDTTAEIRSAIEAARTETARIGTEIERLTRTVAAVQETAEGARKEGAGKSASLSDRVGKAEQALSAKIAALSERVEQAGREEAGRFAALGSQIEKQRAAAPAQVAAVTPVAAPVPAAPVPAAPTPVAAKPDAAKAEPVQTGSIDPRKEKAAVTTSVVETWAVRDVYDGLAILEDRRRRLIEVAAGGTVPGVGRVDGIERRGRMWVVVTRQGLITPQAW